MRDQIAHERPTLKIARSGGEGELRAHRNIHAFEKGQGNNRDFSRKTGEKGKIATRSQRGRWDMTCRSQTVHNPTGTRRRGGGGRQRRRETRERGGGWSP